LSEVPFEIDRLKIDPSIVASEDAGSQWREKGRAFETAAGDATKNKAETWRTLRDGLQIKFTK